MKTFIRLSIYTIYVVMVFISGILYENYRMDEVELYTEETNVRFETVFNYIIKYHDENGEYPENIEAVNYYYTGSKLDYERTDKGFSLGVFFPERTIFSRYFNLEDEYTKRLENPLGVGVYGG